MGSNYEYDPSGFQQAQNQRNKLSWAQLGVGFIQGLHQSMEQARQQRLHQQQIDFQQNLETQRLGLERQNLDVHQQSENDTRDWRKAQIAREQQNDEFMQQYHRDTLAQQGAHYQTLGQQAQQEQQFKQQEFQQRGAKDIEEARARAFTQEAERQKLGLEFYKQGLQPPSMPSAPAGGQARFDDTGFQQAMGGGSSLPGMPTMPAPGEAPQQTSAWQAGPGMQPELRHALTGIRPRPSYDEQERKRLDQGQIVGDYLRDTLQGGVAPDLKGGKLVIDKQPVTAQALLANPSLAHRIAYELNGTEGGDASSLSTTNIFLSDLNPKSPLGRMGLRPTEFGAMLAQGLQMAQQDPQGFAAMARIDQRKLPPRAKDLVPATSRDAVGGGRQQVDNSGAITPGHGAPRDIPRERQFTQPPEAPASQPAQQAARAPGLRGDLDELTQRIEAGDPLALSTANEFGILPDSAVPPQVWAISGRTPPQAVQLQHQMMLQQHVDQMQQARTGQMQLNEERGKQVRQPAQPGYGGRIDASTKLLQLNQESQQRGEEAYRRVPKGPVRRY